MDGIANWVWQGSVVAAAATVLVRAPRSLGAAGRYRLWWVAMAIVLALPLAPAIAGLMAASTVVMDASPDVSRGMTSPLQLRVGAPRWAPPAIVAVWLVWVALSMVRVLSAVAGLRRAHRAARPFPADRAGRLAHWSAVSTGGRRAALVLSDDVRYAAVLGGPTPAIAISPAVADSLADRDLDRIVVHEWAHVQRRDDRARLVQLIVRAVAGLHPGVWWLDRQIHIDRETACDDWAVAVTGSAKSYAASLTRLAAIRSHVREDILQPAALTSSELTRRVMRLLDDRRVTTTPGLDVAPAFVVPALGLAAFAVAAVPLVAIDLASAPTLRTTHSTTLPPAVAAPPEADGVEQMAPRRVALPAAARPRPDAARTGPVAGPTASQAPVAAPAAPPVPAPEPENQRTASRVPPGFVPGLPVNPPGELPGLVTAPSAAVDGATVAPTAQTAYDFPPKSPWGAAADAGVNVGRGSQKAAVATAGFFSKLGKSIARSF